MSDDGKIPERPAMTPYERLRKGNSKDQPGSSSAEADAEVFLDGVHTPGHTTIQVSPNGRLVIVVRDTNPDAIEWEERYGVNWVEFDNLVGRLLTLCDATFTDQVQRKAFKDMVRQHIKEWVADVARGSAFDAGVSKEIGAPFVHGVLDEPSQFWGVEGEATDPPR